MPDHRDSLRSRVEKKERRGYPAGGVFLEARWKGERAKAWERWVAFAASVADRLRGGSYNDKVSG